MNVFAKFQACAAAAQIQPKASSEKDFTGRLQRISREEVEADCSQSSIHALLGVLD
jgi:hypothetical protein